MPWTERRLFAAAGEEDGEAMYRLAGELYPYCRSLTGDGVRRTLRRIGEEIDLDVHEVPTGTRVFDWEVPREWNVHDAWIAEPGGRRIVDFDESNLHVVGYSSPVDRQMDLEELRPHLHTLPDRPDLIPYRTSYYSEGWGFCLRHRTLEAMEEGTEYEVRIDATLEPGHLTYGECFVPGETDGEVLVHTHVCHPSLCNDNLSGIVVAARLARRVAAAPRRFGYRFLFLPGTLGAITWLARNEDRTDRIRHGLVLSNLGDPADLTYKRSRRGDAAVDRAAEHVLAHRPGDAGVVPFEPYGYDERQYCSPAFDLPVGCLSRSRWGEYPEYHTSADDLDLVTPEALADSLDACLDIVEVLEEDGRFRNLNPKCEPQLGRRGLYDDLGGRPGDRDREMAMLWVLNQSDGGPTLLDIARRAGLPFRAVRGAADALLDVGLLEELEGPGEGGRRGARRAAADPDAGSRADLAPETARGP